MRRHTPKKKFEWKKSEKKVSVRNQYTMPTITFSDEQFQALKNILDNMEYDEHRWVQENHEDCEGEADDTADDVDGDHDCCVFVCCCLCFATVTR